MNRITAQEYQDLIALKHSSESMEEFLSRITEGCGLIKKRYVISERRKTITKKLEELRDLVGENNFLLDTYNTDHGYEMSVRFSF